MKQCLISNGLVAARWMPKCVCVCACVYTKKHICICTYIFRYVHIHIAYMYVYRVQANLLGVLQIRKMLSNAAIPNFEPSIPKPANLS